MPHRLHAYGLDLLADLAIVGAQPAPDGRLPDATVVLSGASAEDWTGSAGPYRLDAEALTFCMPGVARYVCSRRGDRVTILPREGVSEQALAEYLVATALPALLWCRGTPVLHAAGAVPAGCDHGVALAGRSGIGKSTLLRRLLEAGASVVGDDSLALRVDRPRQVRVSGLPGATRVAGEGERFVPVPATRQRESAGLRCVIELVGGGGPEWPEQQHGAEALALLLRNLHRPRAMRLLGLEGALLPVLATLAGSLAVYRWGAQCALRCSVQELARIVGGL